MKMQSQEGRESKTDWRRKDKMKVGSNETRKPYLANRQGDGQRARVQFACERAHGPETGAPRQSDEQNGGRLGGAPRCGHCGGGEGARGSTLRDKGVRTNDSSFKDMCATYTKIVGASSNANKASKMLSFRVRTHRCMQACRAGARGLAWLARN